MKRYKITMILEEDTHIGSGAGRAITVDAMCIRDKDGYPVIPAGFLKGIVKDAYTDKNTDAVFGRSDNARGSAIFSSLYYDHKNTKSPKDCFITHTSTSINDSGVSEQDMLRVVEYIRAGSEFSGVWYLPDNHADLIIKSLHGITAVGNSKTRGYGQVKWKVEVLTPELEKKSISVPDDSVGIRLLLKNIDPLCLPASTVKDNVISTEDFIRGQRINGALFHYLSTHMKDKKQIADILFNSMVTCSNGYPCPSDDVTDIYPFPLNLKKYKYLYKDIQKEKLFTVEDKLQPYWSVDRPETVYTSEESSLPVKRPGAHDYLFSKGDGKYHVFSPAIQIHMRNQIVRDGKVNETILYAEEQLVEGCYFPVDVYFNSHEKLKHFVKSCENLLAGKDPLRIGRGGRPLLCSKYSFLQSPIVNNKLKQGESYYLLFTSDTILRDTYNNFIQQLGPSDIIRLLNLQKDSISIEQYFLDTVRITGFNSASGFNLNPKIGIRRGSCVKFKLTKDCEREQHLLTEGYDLGYGQFRILQEMPAIKQSEQFCESSSSDSQKQVDLFNIYYDKLCTSKTYSQQQLKGLKMRIRDAMFSNNFYLNKVFSRGTEGLIDQESYDIDLFYLALRKYLANTKER